VCTLKERSQKRFEKKYGLKKKEWWLWLNRVVTFFLVMIALVFFRANTLEDGTIYISKVCMNFDVPFIGIRDLVFILLGLLITFVAEYSIEYKKVNLTSTNSFQVYLRCSCFLVLAIFFLGVFDGGQFIYFQF
jgi:hypothetical protein